MFVKEYKKFFIYKLLLLAAMPAMLISCVDDTFFYAGEDVVEGEPATVSLTVQLPAMTSMTRAAGVDPDGNEASYVKDLWVGIYNVSTGNRTAVDYKKNYNQDFSNINHDNNSHHKITIDEALSGRCYIVAVANASVNDGIGSEGERAPMENLLEYADTWEKFKSITAVLMGSADNMQHPGADFLMSGIYIPHNQSLNYQSYINADGNPTTPVVIQPGKNNLDGCVQLRRVASYVKFNIEADPNIDFTPVSWQVCNLPAVSYVHERGDGVNAADLGMDVSGIFGDEIKTYNRSFIQEYSTFEPNRDPNKNITGYSFDFYQMENKHTALKEKVKEYADREREFKKNDILNTGWYRALVESEGPESPALPNFEKWSNNNASYVILRARVDYYYSVDENGNPTNNYKPEEPPTDPDNPLYVHRIGEAIYTIHLGYCEGKDGNRVTQATLNDFNCRRNTKYTYNITINGVDKIRVEAQKDGEIESGAEGTVSDIGRDIIELDSHYGVFNIRLSDAERQKLSWRIQAPFDNMYIDMVCGTGQGNSNSSKFIYLEPDSNDERYNALPTNQFYNWIQIRPTSGPDILAHYPGDPRILKRKIRNDDTTNEGEFYPVDNIKDYAHLDENGEVVDEGKGVWYLETLRDVVNFPHPYDTYTDEYKNYLITKLNGEATPEDDTRFYAVYNDPRWYTVFIDEYAYIYDYAGDQPDLTSGDYSSIDWEEDQKEQMDIQEGWHKFVNIDNRKVWIHLNNRYVSDDFESIYSNAAYFISQESIQTYYSNSAPTAIGLESTNESYNNQFFDQTDYMGSYNATDGLYNQYMYVLNKNNLIKKQGRLEWNNVIYEYNDNDINGNTYRLREGVLRTNPNGSGLPHTYYIPEHQGHYMDACLARNRDLNNDGQIGANEIRWYLPTDATYTRMLLGSPSLRSPLFQLNLYDPGDITAGIGMGYSHYIGSNASVTWAEELASTSKLSDSWMKGQQGEKYWPTTLRCVRNLGQYMNLTPDNGNDGYEPIDWAYTKKDGNIIELAFYRTNALRGYTEASLPLHNISEINSYASKRFQYSQKYCNSSNTPTQTISEIDDKGELNCSMEGWIESLRANNICGQYSEDSNDRGSWRVPNITELGILHLLDLLDKRPGNDKYYRYISSSREYFLNREKNENVPSYMGIIDNNIAAWNSGSAYTSYATLYVRCVRDVE